MTDSSPHGPVFISFASEDLAVADRFLASLERSGLRCWIAHRDIPAGASYPVAITSAIESAGALLVLVTDAANASPHVLREVELAFGAGKPMLPVRLSSVLLSQSLNYFLSTKQWLDAGAGFDDGDIERARTALERLMLEGVAAAAPGGTGRIDEAPWWRRNIWWLAGAATLLALAAVALSLGTWGDSPPSTASASSGNAPSSPDLTDAAASSPRPGDDAKDAGAARGPRVRVNKVDGQTYLWIPPGEFVMGCSPGDPACAADEHPAHTVAIRGFWLAQTELTGAQYRKGAPGGTGTAVTPDSPVTALTWAQAKAYCAAAGGRLPTEAEWEYAARAGSTTRAYGRPAAIGWHLENSDDTPHPVATLKPNAWGLYDMLGNVHEWVLDRYFNKYDDTDDGEPIMEPTAPNALATVRGGAWTTEPGNLRVSMRLERDPDAGDPNIGVRCARSGGQNP